MKKILFIMMFILLSTCVLGIETKITDVDCVGTYSVKTKILNSNSNELDYKNCDLIDDLMICDCDIANELILITNDNLTNEYDIIIEYYLVELNQSNSSMASIQNDANKRTKEFNNIKVKALIEEKEPFKMPPITEGKLVFIIIGSIVMFIFTVLTIIIYYVFFREQKEEEPFKKHLSDKEIYDAVMNKYK